MKRLTNYRWVFLASTFFLLFVFVITNYPLTLRAQQSSKTGATATVEAAWTPFVVTSTPTPVDIFIAAGLALEETAQAESVGTATPTPVNMVTATPTLTKIVVTNTPTAQNESTRVYMSRLSTAIALTTGTPDPEFVATATNTPITPTPVPTVTPTAGPTQAPQAPPAPKPTATFTPVFIYLNDLPPIVTPAPAPTTALPLQLVDKILFLSNMRKAVDRRGRIIFEPFVMNPDGSGVALLTSRLFYNRALLRDAYSADQRFFVFARREEQFGTRGKFQIYYDDAFYDSSTQATFFGAGTAWDPVWSPDGNSIALVSNESSNDEIWVVRKDEWPAVQLTKDDYDAWDHHPSWSADGTQIVFESTRTGMRQIWVMDVDGSNQRPLTGFEFEARDPVWVKYVDS